MLDSDVRFPILLVLVAALALPGCDALCSQLDLGAASCPLPADAPEVSVTHLSLLDAPEPKALAANYCADYFGLIGQIGCEAALGGAPSKSDLGFTFGVGLTMSNPVDVPVPATDVLIELTLFDDDAAALGSVCVTLCGAGNPNCDGSPKPGACDTSGGIDSWGEAAAAVPSLISGIATGELGDDLQKSSVPAGGDVNLGLAFTLGIDAALDVIGGAADRFMDDAVLGGDLGIAIPVVVSGEVFFDVPSAGRVGVPFGPFESTWQVQ